MEVIFTLSLTERSSSWSMPLLHCEFHGNFKGEKTDMDLILQKVTFLDQFRYEFGQRFLILLSDIKPNT